MAISPVKVGDKVQATKNCSGALAGQIYTVWDSGSELKIMNCSCINTWQKIGGPMENLKNYFNKHQDTFITLAIIILVDEFILGGSLREKVKSIIDRILAHTEKKLLKETKQ